MDGYREFPSEFDSADSPEVTASEDVAAAIGTDERRMHVRAYNHWVSLLEGRDFPSIEDLEPGDIHDFAGNSVLLDFTCGRDNPAIPYIGAAIREECGLNEDAGTINDVPSRSLLSRLTDHYMQIIANRAPIGFEAEFANQREETICYRGILMPFSSDGDSIDFIYGVINWKRVDATDHAEELDEPLELTEAVADAPLELEQEFVTGGAMGAHGAAGDEAEIDEAQPALEASDSPPVHFSWEDGPIADIDAGELPEVELAEDAGLADRLWAARETADAVKAGEGRTRSALYRALSLAYDFALAARENADEYAELLEESGVKAQARAPMTPIVKLIFGIDYDKARLTEFAAALSYALRQEVAIGGFQDLIEKQAGGLKALVAAERQAKRPDARPDAKGEVARTRLRSAAPISLADLPEEEEFALVVTRRGSDGRHEAVAMIADEALLERAIRHAA